MATKNPEQARHGASVIFQIMILAERRPKEEVPVIRQLHGKGVAAARLGFRPYITHGNECHILVERERAV